MKENIAERPMILKKRVQKAHSKAEFVGMLYLIGTPYMGLILNLYLGKGMSVWQIVRAGCLLYLPGDALKIVVCTLLCGALRTRMPKALATT